MKELSELMTFSAHPDLKNGVTPNVAFFEHMYTSMSAGTAEIALSSVTAATLSATQLEVPYMSISAYSVSAFQDVSLSAGITGFYSWYLNDYHKQIDLMTKETSISAQELSNELGYFKWKTIILDAAADAISGVMHIAHNEQKDLSFSPTGAVAVSESEFLTITAHAWNIDETEDLGAYVVTPSELTLYITDGPAGSFSQSYSLYDSYEKPLGSFNYENHFWIQFDISSLFGDNYGTTYYYWIKCKETWTDKITYSGTGNFKYVKNPEDATWDYSGSGVSGDTTGWSRGLPMAHEHRALAVSVNAGAVTGGSDWYWRNIFSTSWTL